MPDQQPVPGPSYEPVLDPYHEPVFDSNQQAVIMKHTQFLNPNQHTAPHEQMPFVLLDGMHQTAGYKSDPASQQLLTVGHAQLSQISVGQPLT